MKNNKILLFIFLFKLSFLYIIYPFQTRKPIINENEKNITLIFNSLIQNHIFINIDIGEPKQLIDIFLHTDKANFILCDNNKNDINTNSPNPRIEDVNSNINNFYNKNKSETINITQRKAISDYAHKNNIIIDYLHFNNSSNEIKKKKFNIILYNSTFGNMPGVIGLQTPRYTEDIEFNFVEQLKSNELIDFSFWMINYTTEYEGNLILGEWPHIIDSIYFNEKEFYYSHPYLYTPMKELGLRFNDITFQNNNFRPHLECYFRYELNYIKGIDYYENMLDKYFNESIINRTCFKKNIKNSYRGYNFYYCNKEKYKNYIKLFPPLIFEHDELNYTFELNYKDLFIEKDDNYILMVFFDSSRGQTYWHFGKPFLKKYRFLINQDSKLVGFYKNIYNNEIDNNNNGDNKNSDENSSFQKHKLVLIIIFLILGCCLLLLIGIFIGKYFFKNKKTRLNVIDEEYDYNTQNNEILSP